MSSNGPTAGLILMTKDGTQNAMGCENQTDVKQENLFGAESDGSKSMYVLYSKADFGGQSITSNCRKVTHNLPIKSFQGFDMEGMVLFTSKSCCGKGALLTKSVDDIKEDVSSFIVMQGKWCLYDQSGSKVEIDGKDEFGQGKYDWTNKDSSCRVCSIKRL